MEVQYSTVDGTATEADRDYTAGTRSFSFQPDEFEYDDSI